MSQEQILKVLEENELTRKEIQERLQLTHQAVTKALHQLIKYNEIIKENTEKIPVYKLKKKNGAKAPE